MKKSTITLGIAAAMSTVLLGSCGLGQKHDESEVRFSHIQAEASYRLVGSGEDYEFADSCDLSYGCKAEFIMPEVLFGRDVRELQDTIIMLAFNKKGENVAKTVREALPAMASDAGYELLAFSCIPVRFLFWDGDDEFPAQANILFDKSATDYIHVESLVSIASEGLSLLSELSNLPLNGNTFV